TSTASTSLTPPASGAGPPDLGTWSPCGKRPAGGTRQTTRRGIRAADMVDRPGRIPFDPSPGAAFPCLELSLCPHAGYGRLVPTQCARRQDRPPTLPGGSSAWAA